MTSDQAPEPNAAAASGRAAPLPFDTSVANQARVYDYLLGGKDNYAADRAAAKRAAQVYPDGAFTARANRAFLGRAVRFLAADEGIRQFVDIGTGIPTAGNVHEVAQAIAPESRVLYADYDRIVLAHARALLTSHEAGATDYIEADLRDTTAILGHARRLLDLTKPVAVTLVAILHAIPDADDPHGIVSKIMDAVPPGSYLAVTHMAWDILDQSTQQGLDGITGGLFQQELTYRSREQVGRFFEGTDLVEPGLVRAEQWRPDTAAGDGRKSFLWCAVGRKR
ncbi:MAG: SAM-dependent methyltransferase [Trebonia sp.]